MTGTVTVVDSRPSLPRRLRDRVGLVALAHLVLCAAVFEHGVPIVLGRSKYRGQVRVARRKRGSWRRAAALAGRNEAEAAGVRPPAAVTSSSPA